MRQSIVQLFVVLAGRIIVVPSAALLFAVGSFAVTWKTNKIDQYR